MSAPEKLWAKSDAGFDGIAGTWLDEPDGPDMRPYTRDDIVQALIAAKLEEVVSVIQYHRDYGMVGPDGDFLGDESEVIAHGNSMHYAMMDIAALITPDMAAALEAVKAEARREERERAAGKAQNFDGFALGAASWPAAIAAAIRADGEVR